MFCFPADWERYMWNTNFCCSAKLSSIHTDVNKISFETEKQKLGLWSHLATLGDNINIKTVGTCHSTDQSGTQKSRFMTEKVEQKNRNVSCRVINSVAFWKESQKLIQAIRIFLKMDLKMYVFLKNEPPERWHVPDTSYIPSSLIPKGRINSCLMNK